MSTAIILAAITLGIPLALVALALFECWQHQKELDRAERDMEGRL